MLPVFLGKNETFSSVAFLVYTFPSGFLANSIIKIVRRKLLLVFTSFYRSFKKYVRGKGQNLNFRFICGLEALNLDCQSLIKLSYLQEALLSVVIFVDLSSHLTFFREQTLNPRRN